MQFTREDNKLNQYHSWGVNSAIYDEDAGGWGSPQHANGVLMQEGHVTAGYNSLNQMVMVAGTSNWIFFGYDPLGRRVKQWTGGLTGNNLVPEPGDSTATYFYYDEWNLIQEGPSAAVATRNYIHGARVDEIVKQITPGNWWERYFHYDARGHCSLQTDAGGNIVEQYDYDAFGQPYFYDWAGNALVQYNSATQQWEGYSPWGNRFLFTGREWLSDNGASPPHNLKLYDFRNRMYQPELGRFMSPDPKHFAAGDYNLYRYCHNDPVNRSDPMGLVDGMWDRQMYLQGGEQRSFEVVERIKDLHSNGWVTVGHMLFTEKNQTDSTPGQPRRNLGGSKLDRLGAEMAKMAFNTGPPGQEQISWLFEKNGTPGAYAASVPTPGGAEPKQFKEEGNAPRLGVSATPTFIPKGYHYVGFAYSHLLADKVIPLIDRQRAWRNRLDAYLAVPHQGTSFPDVLQPYHYDPNVFPSN
jgi:RHS repeat-associated protein